MAPQTIHLPDGQTFNVTPVFSGLFFKPNQLSTHPGAYPTGWTVVLNTQEDGQSPADGKHHGHPQGDGADDVHAEGASGDGDLEPAGGARHSRIRSYTKPTLQNDNLFISSVSTPASSEYKAPASPTRQTAMMLWVTLYWYFHQPEPLPYLATEASRRTPDVARPRGDWRINVRRDGVLRSRNTIPKLERMGLIASLDSSADQGPDGGEGGGWDHMFVSRKMFWQIPGRLFLFGPQPNAPAHSVPGSPAGSRPGSPRPMSPTTPSPHHAHPSQAHGQSVAGLHPDPSALPPGPFYSSSHLPTYYPPAPLSYTTTNNTRHPLRPKPPRPGEVFYTRFVPSAGQYLSFRVASTSPDPTPYHGPVGPSPPPHPHLRALSDTALLRSWLSNPRVSEFWGGFTDDFLPAAAASRHSFPAVGLWDGVPFGFFEVYWVREDALGRNMGGGAGDWDRGLHVLIGEEWARGRVPSWLSSLVHWCLVADYRTMSICLEPRVDNERFLEHLQRAGFSKERQIAFPHKQSWLIRMRREDWEGPAL